MQVNFAHHFCSKPSEHGSWGNSTKKFWLKFVPWASPLVEQLQAETGFEALGDREWSALFYFDVVDGNLASVNVEMKPARASLKVAPLPLTSELLPSADDIRYWVVNNIRRA